MAHRCSRLERLFFSPALSRHAACIRRASSTAVVVHPSNVGQSQAAPSLPLSGRPKVLEFLQYVQENADITLVDLESFRPKSHPPVGTAEYDVAYQALMDRLDRSFTSKQLRRFLGVYGMRVSSKMRKRGAAATIIEKQWGWPSLAESQKLAKREMFSRAFPLKPEQAFLLLGRDGADILSLSQTFSVRLQFSRKPLSLTVSGTTDSVDELEKHVEALKKEIIWQDFDPPYKFDITASAQQLSRDSGCFLEGLPDGRVRIWYRESLKESSSMAKRLIMQQCIEGVKVPLVASSVQSSHYPDHPDTYALYPFFSVMPNVSLGRKVNFRLRRVGNWLGDEETAVFNDNDENTRSYFTSSGSGEYGNAREQLLSQVNSGSGQDCQFSVTATAGHIIFSPRESQSSLMPPLEGKKSFDEVMNWMREKGPNTRFFAGAPMRCWQAPDPTQEWKRRLVFVAVSALKEQEKVLICEFHPGNPLRPTPAEVEVEERELPKPTLRGGLLRRLDVLMPDDPRDIRLTLTDNKAIPETLWPADLLEYVNESMISPASSEVPLMLEFGSKKYILKEDFYTQSNASPVEDGSVDVSAISERRFNPQNEESSLSFEVKCGNISSDASWTSFWQKCEDIVHDRAESLPRADNLYQEQEQ
ncbi:hypothetical protein AGABI1DRAFT_124120 [Agaricus bisporus var. burnettii JB137-S8]|uniref:Uncharacterized protein n=1 Tax=Agaricus bisporus var. burnettii (strain JB137-S8 / ATCC MYA-4627 / FGSC 10392) TaxID=597362 RepID=K5XJT7_AGABU|nr:uncharacterized protein AGABI1DRAFT_124120 [Agaricus bisporus var. burnettii JB137-S8]EKM83793.1 hypothetical protein AGABI1DRAFT_124120 [Agaricus bisporus var. burnettii JB137-S8]